MAPANSRSARPAWYWRSPAWAVVLTLIGITQAMRAVYVDAAIFFAGAGAVALVVDEFARPDAQAVRRARPAPRPVIVVAGALAAVVLVFAPRHGAVVAVTLAAVGAASVAAAWAPRPAPPAGVFASRAVRRAAAWWAAVVIAICLWELASFLWGLGGDAASRAHPAISDLLDPALDAVPGRLLFVAAWGWLGLVALRPSLGAEESRVAREAEA